MLKTQRIIGVSLLVLVFSFPMIALEAYACSDIILGDKTNLISARTMDFDIDLRSDIKVVPRGQKVTSNAPNGKNGLSWVSKYGFVGVNALDIDKYCDGMNEKGLSIGTLWLDESAFPQPKSADNALSIQDIGAWMLGNFATVDEVKAALKNVTVWGEKSKELGGMVPPLHLAVHDALGNNLVVEFVNGEMKVYDNPKGVLTNSPTFDWHLTNTGDTDTIYPVGAQDHPYAIPGESMSVSRFIRLLQLKSNLPKVKSSNDAVQLAVYVINRVNVVPGERMAQHPNPLMPYTSNYTEWTVVRDHTNLVYYYKTLMNNSLRAIDLKKVNFDEKQPVRALSMDRDNADLYQDMTDKLR